MSKNVKSAIKVHQEKPPEPKLPRFKNIHKLFICKLFAQDYGVSEVVEQVVNEFGEEWGIDKENRKIYVKLLRSRLKYIKYDKRASKYQNLIKDLHDSWIAGMGKDQRLWNKSARIQELNNIVNLALQKKLIQKKKIKLGEGNYDVYEIYGRDLSAAIQAIRAIAEEKGDLPPRGEGINIYGDVYQDNRQISQTAIVKFRSLDERTKREVALGILRAERALESGAEK